MDRRSAPLLAIHLRLEISSYRAMSSIAVTAATAASTIAQPQLSMADPPESSDRSSEENSFSPLLLDLLHADLQGGINNLTLLTTYLTGHASTTGVQWHK